MDPRPAREESQGNAEQFGVYFAEKQQKYFLTIILKALENTLQIWRVICEHCLLL